VSKSGAASIDTPYPSLDEVAEGLGISRARARRTTVNLRTLLDQYERSLIEYALEQSGGNQRRAAASLGLLPTTLHEKMKRLGFLRGLTALDDPDPAA
jgi:DNA-binding NtrC family response regulator